LFALACVCVLAGPSAAAQRAPLEIRYADPYLGAIVVDADTGQVLFADNPDTKGYPASVLKMMDLLILLEKVSSGAMRLDEKITISAEVSNIGGSQVYLKENEVFTVDELLYALMVQSGNDAAAALAIRAAGSKEAFVALMNQRAAEIGMKSTEFHSIHGLPPAKDQLPDVTSARDMARLARELLTHPESLRYTSCKKYGFRENKFIMDNHNRLLFSFPGCDGLKTGWFRHAGYSVAATAKRDDKRVIAIVLGSASKKTRDRKAAELMNRGLALIPQKPAFVPPPAVAEKPVIQKEEPRRSSAVLVVVSIIALLIISGACYWFFFYRPKDSDLVQRH